MWQVRLSVLLGCALLAGCFAPARDAAPLVVVAGGSGRTGAYVIESLRETGYRVRPLTQDSAGARERIAGSWDWRQVDVRDPARVREAVAGADYVICVLGARQRSGPNSFEFVDYGGVRNVVDAAVDTGVEHFVLISSAAAGPHRKANTMVEVGNVRYWKTQGENHLKRSGLAYTIIGPGGLEDGPSQGSGLRALSRRDYTTGLIARGDVARVAVASLEAASARYKSFALIRDPAVTADAWRELVAAIPADATTQEAPPALE